MAVTFSKMSPQIVGAQPSKVISVRPLLLNAYGSISVTLAGIVMLVSELQYANVSLWIMVTPAGIVTEGSFWQEKKAE